MSTLLTPGDCATPEDCYPCGSECQNWLPCPQPASVTISGSDDSVTTANGEVCNNVSLDGTWITEHVRPDCRNELDKVKECDNRPQWWVEIDMLWQIVPESGIFAFRFNFEIQYRSYLGVYICRYFFQKLSLPCPTTTAMTLEFNGGPGFNPQPTAPNVTMNV